MLAAVREGAAARSETTRAGLIRGDVITRIDGVPLDTDRGGRLFSEVLPGQRVVFEVWRLGRTLTVEMVAGEREESGSAD